MKRFFKENWILILSIIYIISPIDFIPEFVAGPLGLVDDLTLVIFLLLQKVFKKKPTQPVD